MLARNTATLLILTQPAVCKLFPAADTAASTAVRGLKCIDAYEKVNAVVLEVIAARYQVPVKPVTPVELGEHVFIRIEN